MTKFLVCKPTHLHEISYQINPFMKRGEKVDNALALKQHANLVKILEDNGAEVEFIEPQEGLIDMIFTANAGMVYDNKFILPNFKNKERRPEAEHYLKWARQKKYEVISLPSDVFFEGAADVAWIDKQNCFMAHGDLRTNYRAVECLREILKGVNIIPLRLVDERFFHLDTCLRILDNANSLIDKNYKRVDEIDKLSIGGTTEDSTQFVNKNEMMYFRKAFDEESQKKIAKEASQRFTLPEDEALTYICNSVKFGNKLVADKCLWVCESYLNFEGYKVQKANVSELRKGGGSVRCMVLEIG